MVGRAVVGQGQHLASTRAQMVTAVVGLSTRDLKKRRRRILWMDVEVAVSNWDPTRQVIPVANCFDERF